MRETIEVDGQDQPEAGASMNRNGTEAGRVIQDDCIRAMAAMPEASIDAIVTDPQYGLSREPDIREVLTHWLAGDDYKHRGGGFMGKGWDSFVPGPATWTEAYRILKPGGYLLAFASTRTEDLLGIAIRLAGFERRDMIAWLYGSGFPKSLDVSKAIDKAAGAERKVVGLSATFRLATRGNGMDGFRDRRTTGNLTAPATPEAEQWAGWGTALKPAHEPIVVARKPLSGTVAQCVLEHGTGAINVDACRIGTDAQHKAKCESVVGLDSNRNGVAYGEWKGERESSWTPAGRWPANVALDEEAALALDKMTGTRSGSHAQRHDTKSPTTVGGGLGCVLGQENGYGDSGGASRFLYVAKASSAERNAGLDGFEAVASRRYGERDAGELPRQTPQADVFHRNVHPTVKPISLMRWLVRLVTPPGGTVLDPFAGSGTTLVAAQLEGFNSVGIEREAEYAAIAEARIAWWARHPDGMTLVKRLEAEAVRAEVADCGQATLFDFA
jgi:DNA modification methylase